MILYYSVEGREFGHSHRAADSADYILIRSMSAHVFVLMAVGSFKKDFTQRDGEVERS